MERLDERHNRAIRIGRTTHGDIGENPVTHKPKLAIILFMFALLFSVTAARDLFAATCTGSDPCHACKNCKYCRHCAKEGGTCGVCTRS
jgi:hypothetical protein